MPIPSDIKEPVYLYTDKYAEFDYGIQHPLRVRRLCLFHELVGLCGLPADPLPVVPADFETLAEFHDRRYLETLRELSQGTEIKDYCAFGLGSGDNPVFPGVYRLSSISAGATLQAAELVSKGSLPVAFNPGGGMHHALAARASGFCYVNDAALAIKRLVKKGCKVVYLDVDAHHGDGVQWAFYDKPQVLTISLHQHPATLFPGTGQIEEMGRGEGRGYSVNVPLWPDTSDDVFIRCFEEIVPPLIEAFKPDYIVTQLGVDALWTDPLANLNLTTNAFERCLKLMRQMAMGRWIALGGGGYHVINVARAWVLAWAVMLGLEDSLPRELPLEFRKRWEVRDDEKWLLDPPGELRGRFHRRAARDAEEVISQVKRDVFPLVRG